MASVLTKIKLMMVADLVDTSISLGKDEMVCVTMMVRTSMIASRVPIFDFVIGELLSVFCLLILLMYHVMCFRKFIILFYEF